MGVKYFGQYLIENNYITNVHLLEAIKYQKNKNIKLGVMVIDKGYMTSEQVEQALNIQRTQDVPFGEACVDKEFLTREQLEELLTAQKEDRIYLGDALVELGHLTLDKVEKYLIEFKTEQQEAQAEINDAFDHIVPEYKDLVQSSIQIINNMLRRLLDEYGKVSGCHEKTNQEFSYDYLVYQKISGAINCYFGIALNKDTLIGFSSKILKREINAVDEYAIDGVQEFMNIVTGHICVLLSKQNIASETFPPVCVDYKEFASNEPITHSYVVPILMTDEQVDMHFLFY